MERFALERATIKKSIPKEFIAKNKLLCHQILSISISISSEMAMPTANPVVTPSANVVGSAFVDQYYHILHISPELVHIFYQDIIVLTRPDISGVMKTVTTMHAINDMILSLDYKNYKAEIKSADAQESYNGGVTVLVTGCLTGKDHTQKKFAQSFFLAPQDKSYFVFNDVFRYVDENQTQQTNHTIPNIAVESVESRSMTPEPEPTHVTDRLVVESAEQTLDNGPAVLSRLKQFSAMNKLKKMALRVIAESLSEEEIAGLKEMFAAMDTDNSGAITFDELKAGLRRYGSTLKESEIRDLMEAADVDNS